MSQRVASLYPAQKSIVLRRLSTLLPFAKLSFFSDGSSQQLSSHRRFSETHGKLISLWFLGTLCLHRKRHKVVPLVSTFGGTFCGSRLFFSLCGVCVIDVCVDITGDVFVQSHLTLAVCLVSWTERSNLLQFLYANCDLVHLSFLALLIEIRRGKPSTLLL